jgi:uncharacterized protein (DUF2384 family)
MQTSNISTEKLDSLFVDRVVNELVANDASYIATTDFINMMERGANGSVLKEIVAFIPKKIVAKAVGSDVTNISKLYRRRLSKKQTDEINDLSLLWHELKEFFDDDLAFIEQWINHPVPALEGNKPADLMDSFFGRARIRECIEVMKYGDFA